MHVELLQADTLDWQWVPVKPGWHRQLKLLIPSTHFPPFRQELEVQSSSLV